MFKSLKKAFGFVDDDELINDDPETEAPSLPDSPVSSGSNTLPADPSVNTDRIFTHVVEVFNASLPDFLKAGANAEAQRRYLYDTLSADVKNHLDTLAARAQEVCESRWRADRESLNKRLKEIEERSKDLENKRLEMSQKQLSADRQKRALSERVHDLENQLSKLVADREQYDLENKSLINKLKVAGVFEKENEELRDELNRMQSEIIKARNGQAPATPDTETEKRIEAAEARATEAEKKIAESEKKLTESEKKALEAEQKAAEAQKKAADTERQLSETKKKIVETEARAENAEKEALDAALRIEELEKTASKTDTTALKSVEEELAKVRAELAESDEDRKKLLAEMEAARSRESDAAKSFDALQNEIVSHKRTITALEKKIAEQPSADELAVLRHKVKEADDFKSQVEAIESQIALFEDIKTKKDQHINTLKKELAAVRAELAETRKAVDEARKSTISTGNQTDADPVAPAVSRNKNQDNRKRRNDQQSKDNFMEHRERNGRRTKNGPETPIDDILSDTDWLVAPASKPGKSGHERRDNHRPKDNDSQLSLF